MTLAKKEPRTWLCPKCSHRNLATRSRKCQNPDCRELSRPKKRVPVHARTLRDDTYQVYEDLSLLIHGGERGACGYCRKPKPEHGRHERDHDHRTGKPRGLACFVCNRERLRSHTLETMKGGVAYLTRAATYWREHADTGTQ